MKVGVKREIGGGGGVQKEWHLKARHPTFILGLSFLCCVTLGKSLDLSELRFFSALKWKLCEFLPLSFVVRFKGERS